MRFLIVAAAALFVFASGGAAVAQECEAMAGTQISPISFDAAATALSSVPAKDEFETTAQYQTRVEAALAGISSRMLVSAPFDTEYATYNADAGRFEIRSYAVRNLNTDWFTVFYGSPHYGGIRYSTLGNIDLVLSSSDRPNGTYQGQNSYGATWTVTRVTRTVNAIFEREPARYNEELFGQRPAGAAPLTWTLPVPVEQARGMRDRFRAAVLIAPRAPFFFENRQQSAGRITIQNPRDVEQVSRIIVADIQCVVITDDQNNVLIAQRTV
ncbi:MAG: hypothetical protein JNL81_07045 [Hyphomonadaceae bacterium]|nr:hypothetical protein [Hyphomonadaceae bacterium]